MALSVCAPLSIDREGRERAAHGTPLFPVACYRDNISETPVPWHWHEELEALVVEAGIARVFVDGDSYLVGPGEGFWVNAGALHGVWPEGEARCLLRSVVFHPRLVGGGVDSILWQKYVEPLLRVPGLPCVRLTGAKGWECRACEAIQAAWQACVSEAEGYEFGVRHHLSTLLFLLFQNSPAAEKKPSAKTLRDGERTKRMLHYIQEHYGSELTLAQIAGSANISENECLRCFRSMLGCTPIQYVKQVRIQRAAELLLSTPSRISEIGMACGFQEMSYFAKTFRALKGCTPGEFRKRHAPAE